MLKKKKKKKKQKQKKQKTQLGDIFFFIFSICRFLSVLKCLLSMFWEVMKKMEWIYLNQGENMGVSHYYVFAFLVSRIYFSDIYINAKYK